MAKAPIEIRSLARSHTEAAINTLVEINGDRSAAHSARVSAAQALLDRGWGKPSQPVDGDGEGGPVEMTIKWLQSE
jgi:hypothetical protein